jgi:HPt (histidine-containing phosphotransfer) domain-containing protein
MADPVDESTLARLAEDLGDKGLVVEIVDTFLVDAMRLEEHLRAGETSEARSFVRALHTLKSSAAIVGALRLADLCRQAEEAARLGDVAGAKARVPAVLEELGRASAALRARPRA